MKHIVGVADCCISTDPDDLLVTHALGSCLGITAWDPSTRIGGLLHVMLPLSQINPDRATINPFAFVDTGVPRFFQELFEAGADRRLLEVKVAGGACVNGGKTDRFAIGKRNYVVLKKLLWKNGFLISGEDVGGGRARTMYLELASGRVWITSGGRQWDL